MYTPAAEQFFFASPVTPVFSIPMPGDCSFLGASACAQAGAITPTTTIFTNALDLVLGGS